MGTHPIFESDFDCLTDKSLLKMGYQVIVGHMVAVRRSLTLSMSRRIQRESKKEVKEKQKPSPRFQTTPETGALQIVTGGEVEVTKHLAVKPDIKAQCPWCKETKIKGVRAIVCSVWPSHSALEGIHKPHIQHEDEFRGADLRGAPVDVFNIKRYQNQKAYLNAKDPYRMTTPISHKVEIWRHKYGVK